MTTPTPRVDESGVCIYCHGVRLVGWSGAGPILCPECSRDQDAFTVITQAWREQRNKVGWLSAELVQLRLERQRISFAAGSISHDTPPDVLRTSLAGAVAELEELKARRCGTCKLFDGTWSNMKRCPQYPKQTDADFSCAAWEPRR